MEKTPNSARVKARNPTTGSASGDAVSLGEHVRFLFAYRGGGVPRCPQWPADVFAVAASLLARAGAYASILNAWPPPGTKKPWAVEVKRIALQWRRGGQKTPPEVAAAWKTMTSYAGVALYEICNDKTLLEQLVFLSSVADEACAHVGIPAQWGSLGRAESEFYLKALRLVLPKMRGSTLCEKIDPTRVRVLPKMHTPSSGMTIRSLSLHLALVLSDEIVPKWRFTPQPLKGEQFNVLVIPWPFEIPNGAIHACAANRNEMGNMPNHFGFFTYDPIAGDGPAPLVEQLLKSVELKGQRIHALVLPELALTEAQFDSLSALTKKKDIHLIAGVCVPARPDRYPKNEVRFASQTYETFSQQKHHRWKLNGKQIKAYKLGRYLDEAREWWEHIDVSSREFNFYALGDGLVISALICEDLARPDPVGDLIRAVGPNMVFALLMDGPQLDSRWPGRYAASLADDPGSSVLSVTSLGMSLRSKRPKADRSRVVGLWRSPSENWEEIEIAEPDNAVLLSFERRKKQEWAVDGRDDAGQGAYLELTSKRKLRLGHLKKRKS